MTAEQDLDRRLKAQRTEAFGACSPPVCDPRGVGEPRPSRLVARITFYQYAQTIMLCICAIALVLVCSVRW